jgi:hypothetical protein
MIVPRPDIWPTPLAGVHRRGGTIFWHMENASDLVVFYGLVQECHGMNHDES